jgi:hypothetical protein
MTGLLSEPLSADQLRLLRAIFEPFDRSGEWPVWQYVDLTLDAKFGLDAADVLAFLPRVGERSPVSVSYGLTWRDNSHIGPQADTRVMLTVAGLRHLGPGTEPLLGSLLVTLRCLADAQRALVPSPSQVVEATVSSGTIAEELTTWSIRGVSAPPVEATMRKLRQLIGHEPFLYHVVQHPRAEEEEEEWTVQVPAILRAYRNVASIGDYLDRVTGLVIPPEPPSAPLTSGPLDIPQAVGYLDAVWKTKTRSRLFLNLDPHSTARLTLACGSEEEFNSLMSALADVLGQVVTPGKAAPPKGGALEEFRDYLLARLDPDVADCVASAIQTLIRLRHVRVAGQHSDARHKAVAAFREIGLPFPPPSWDHAWTHIAVIARGALDVLREEVHAGLPEP